MPNKSNDIQLRESLNNWAEKWIGEYTKQVIEPYSYKTIRVKPKSKWGAVKQYLKLEPKKYRHKAQKGYVMTRDLFGMPIQVKRGTSVETDWAGSKTIRITKHV